MNLTKATSLLTAALLVGGLTSCKEQERQPTTSLKFPALQPPTSIADIIANPVKLRAGISEGSRQSAFGENLANLKVTRTSAPKDFSPSSYNYYNGSQFDVVTPSNEGYPRIYVDRNYDVIIAQEITGSSILISQGFDRAQEGTGVLQTKDGKHSTMVYKFELPDGGIDPRLRVVELSQDSTFKKPAWALTKKASQKIPKGASVEWEGKDVKLSNQPKGAVGVRLEEGVYAGKPVGEPDFYVLKVYSDGKEETMYANRLGKISRNIPGLEQDPSINSEPHALEGRTIPGIKSEFDSYRGNFSL